MSAAQITVTPYEKRYRQIVDDLLFRNYQVHTHLDWQDVSDWLDSHTGPMRLAWQGQRLVGVIGISQPLNDMAWFRLAAIHDRSPGAEIIARMWQDVLPDLQAKKIRMVYVLAARVWIEDHINRLGFRFQEDIITLRKDGDTIPPVPETNLNVRLTSPRDIDAVTAVDQNAFAPPWQLTREELRQASRIASIFTVAEMDEQIIGYQLCTLYRDGAHLARLAVHSQQQSKGVGAVLLHDVLSRFARRRIYTMTVNTQISNLRSQHLYTRFGFQRNGYDLPVWAIQIPASG